MKKIIYLLAIIFLASCNNQDPATLNSKIAEKKAEIVTLEKEIEDLKKTLREIEGENHQAHNLMKVKTKSMINETFNHYFEASGSLEAVESAVISPELGGKIDQIFVKEGDRVKKGTLLIKINTTVIESTIKELETSLELAKKIYQKQKNLWEKSIGSELQYLEAKNRKESLEKTLQTTKSQLELSYLKSPIDGIIEDVRLKIGEMATPGFPAIQIVNLNKMYVNINVPDKYIAQVHKGDLVNIRFPSYNNLEFSEPIYRTGNVINDQSLTFEVQLKLQNEDEILKPNVLSVVTFNDYTNSEALVLPALVIKQDMKGSYVYVVISENGKYMASKKYIETAKSYNDLTMVTEGLSVNDQVIIEGYNLVSDGLQVNVVL